MTLKMTTAQVVETSVTVTNSSFQNYTHPDDHTTRSILLCIMKAEEKLIIKKKRLKIGFGESGYRSRYLSHAKRALYHLS